jgi:PIN domain nuclease of toxin-antitoxin system
MIGLANGDPPSPETLAAIVQAGIAEGVDVSPASAWEIGMLSKPRQDGMPAHQFLPDPKTWFAVFLACRVATITQNSLPATTGLVSCLSPLSHELL